MRQLKKLRIENLINEILVVQPTQSHVLTTMYANHRFPSLYIHIYTNTHKELYIESRTITTHSITKKKERERKI